MATKQPNRRLEALLEEARMSHTGLARRVVDQGRRRGIRLGTTHVGVGRWISGGGIEDKAAPVLAEVLGDALGRRLTLSDLGFTEATPARKALPDADAGELLDTATGFDVDGLPETGHPGEGDLAGAALAWVVERRPLSPFSHELHGGQVTQRDVAAVRHAAGMFMDLDYLYGGGHGRRALRYYVRYEVLPLLHGRYTEQVGRTLVAATGEVTELLGWTAYDTGSHVLARHYYMGTFKLAQETGDRLLGSRILASMSHQANYLGRFQLAYQLARAAQDGARGTATPRAAAMFAVHEARALASLGDKPGAARALHAAEDALGRADGHEDPPWLAYFDEAELMGERAHCFRDLGLGALTVEHALAAVANADPSYARTLAFCRMVLADGHLQAGDLDQALVVATNALDAADALESARVLRYVEDFERRLPTQRPGRAVEDFRALASSVMRSVS